MTQTPREGLGSIGSCSTFRSQPTAYLRTKPRLPSSPTGQPKETTVGATLDMVGLAPSDSEQHNYRITVYAMDSALTLPAGANYDQVQNALQGHIVAQGTLTGTYIKTENDYSKRWRR